MPEITNLSKQIEKQLPTEMVEFLQTAGLMAASQGQNLYLVGGLVRDILLRRTNLDLDLVVEGDAIELAHRLSGITSARITTHSRFNTAKLRWSQWSVDLATARSETYERPGALPKVQPGSLASDLFRRDFTINAMTVELIPTRYGQLIDLYGGVDDLKAKLIRVLHDRSFIDDATRIWRGLRYEQRLDFKLEPITLELLQRDITMLDTISNDRTRHELELVLKEAIPEKVLHRATELGILSRIHPALKADSWLAGKFALARSATSPLSQLYLGLLAYRLTSGETEELVSRLRLSKSAAQILRETSNLKAILKSLSNPALSPSRVFQLLRGYSPAAITVHSLATESQVARQHIQAFLTKLRFIKPALTGDDLQRLGIPPGPRMKEILQRLHEARLDGKVTTKKGEEELVRGWPK